MHVFWSPWIQLGLKADLSLEFSVSRLVSSHLPLRHSEVTSDIGNGINS